MVKIRYTKVLLEKNERFSQPLTVAPWEVPVLIEAHGKSLISEVGTAVVNRKELPKASAEFQRLINRYKHGENSEVPYVTRVYGVAATAVKIIEKMIADSVVRGDDTGAVETGVELSIDDATEISDLAFVSGDAEPQEGAQEIPA